MTRTEMLQTLRVAVGRAHDVDLGDVGAWAGEALLHAGFYDPRAGRPRTFAAVADELGRITIWEEPAAEAAA